MRITATAACRLNLSPPRSTQSGSERNLPTSHGGFIPTRRYSEDHDGDLAQRIKAYAERSAAHAADFASYTQAVDERAQASKLALTPLRHIETIAEAGARKLAARAASALVAVASALPARSHALDLGAVTSIGSASTPLGDAEPFEFGDMPRFGDSFDIAKTPKRGEPGTWYTNAGSGQMRLYGDTGAPVVDFDFDHDHGQGIPHAHNYGPPGSLSEFNRGTGRSFSLLPW